MREPLVIMKNTPLYIVIFVCLFWGQSHNAQNMHSGYWSNSRFSEGHFDIKNDAPNNFVLLFNDKSSNYIVSGRKLLNC